jgi:dihydrofolate synthase/folylpolyglutamate synthase
MLTYNQALEYLESFINYEKLAAPYDPRKWKLERMHRLLSKVGNPHMNLNSIHIAGTKGKGSTAAMIDSILREAGYKVGLYTSPHLISFRERIRINGEMISEDQVCELVNQLKPYIEDVKKQSDDIGHLSFFDVYTTLGFLYFVQEKVDFAVLEVGMGGRLDATNVVTPLVSVITQISYDHMISLGYTLDAIAGEKAGIIKDNGYVITSPQEPEAMKVIKDTCAEKNARLFEVGKHINFQKSEDSESRNLFNIDGICGKYHNLYIPLLGDHQLINAATAVGALEILQFHNVIIPTEAVKTGLDKVKWQARVQVIRKSPIIILDVAHNAASAKALKESIVNNFDYDKLILVIGGSIHKDIKGMGQHLCPITDNLILTKVDNPRAIEPEDMKTELAGICNNIITTPNTASALEKAISLADAKDLICITGSVYLAGEIMQILDQDLDVRQT